MSNFNLLRLTSALLVAWSASASLAQSGVLRVDAAAARSPAQTMRVAEAASRDFTLRVARLTDASRRARARAGLYHFEIPFSIPIAVHLGSPNPLMQRALASGRSGGGITLQFDSSGPYVFSDPAYKQLLVDTFAQAKGTMDAVFGAPALGGTVYVRKYNDPELGDRQIVAGGVYVHDNGSGQREIRFPEYSSREAAAVNFVHCLLLAYLGPNAYAFDAFQEGLVRAATMRIVRTPGALPASLDAQLVGFVLENTYDVGAFYDLFNQRALGGPVFIAPNLMNVNLPPGGSLGGIYLLRYQMAGSAWQKVLAEYPAFIKTFNEQFYLNPSIAADVPALVALGQSVMDSLVGPGATVEGLPFAEWFRGQFILETALTRGLKLIVHPVPFPPESGSSDFGVFLVEVTYFETRANGDEVLLSGVSFPIFWDPSFNRIFPSVQEDRMDIAGAYGSVVPNLPNMFGGQPYRCTVDIPVQDRIARAYLPAGAVATGSNPSPRDFYGTVVGVAGGAGVSMRVRLTVGLDVVDNIPVTNGAFGTTIGTPSYLGYQRLRVEVIRTQNSVDTVVIDRRVNKGPGPLGLDLRPENGVATYAPALGLPKGLSTLGVPLDPYASLAGDVLGLPEDLVLVARWNASKARHDIYPDCGSIVQGHGYFVRMPAANITWSVFGRTSPNIAIGVALRPGWNLVANPLPQAVSLSNVVVARAADLPRAWADAAGQDVGIEFFEFQPGALDEATGAPETGTMAAATQFETGKAYFVRVLAAEGVTLLFRPGAPPSSAPHLWMRSFPARSWHIGLTLRDGPFAARAILGQTPTANRGFDPREDSGLPPSMGGMQIVLDGPESAMYRDVRRYRSAEAYRFRAVGLKPGKTYVLRLDLSGSGLQRYRFTDFDAVRTVMASGSGSYSFVARSATRRFEIRVGPESW